MYTAAWMYQPSLAPARLAAMRSISSEVIGVSDLDDATIERSIAEINEAIRRSGTRKT